MNPTTRTCSDAAVSELRERLTASGRTDLTAFTSEGISHSFDDVQPSTLTIRTIGGIGGFRVLSFKTLDFRTVNVLDISYWTVDEK